MLEDERMGPWGFPIKKSITCNQKTVAEYLMQKPIGATKHDIMFRLGGIGGEVFAPSVVTRVIDAMVKNGKVYRQGGFYLINEPEGERN